MKRTKGALLLASALGMASNSFFGQGARLLMNPSQVGRDQPGRRRKLQEVDVEALTAAEAKRERKRLKRLSVTQVKDQ